MFRNHRKLVFYFIAVILILKNTKLSLFSLPLLSNQWVIQLFFCIRKHLLVIKPRQAVHKIWPNVACFCKIYDGAFIRKKACLKVFSYIRAGDSCCYGVPPALLVWVSCSYAWLICELSIKEVMSTKEMVPVQYSKDFNLYL